MARTYRDLLVDEDDGKIRVNLLNRDGTVALHDVSMELSSPVAQEGDSFGAAAANLLLQLDEDGAPEVLPDVAIGVYTHAKNGTAHTLTGKGNNIRFVAAADFTAGDTITVNGAACTAATLAGDALWSGFWRRGAVVTCYRAGSALTFSGAGLSAADKAQLVPGNLLESVRLSSGGVNVAGGIPINNMFEFQIPMYSNDGISIPAGYYPSPISVKPVYVSGTTFTDFSGDGPFGLCEIRNSSGSNTTTIEDWYANTRGCFVRVRVNAEHDGQAAYGGNVRFMFQVPYSAPWDYCILRGSVSSGAKVAANWYTINNPAFSWAVDYGSNLNGRAAYSPSTPYLGINMGHNGTAAWGISHYECTISSITFYKNAT